MKDILWVNAYRPKTVSDTILPESLKQQFQNFVDTGNIPNLILAGRSGCGKTTVATAMLEELGCDYIIINGSLNGNIDTLRTEILQFASSISFTGKRKFVILDEGDNLSQATQLALRNFTEEYSKNCGFIFTCNYLHRILPALHSRCSIIEFRFRKEDAIEMKKQMLKRLVMILKKEGVEFDPKIVLQVIQKYFPDFRRTLMELQSYSVSGKIDSGILAAFDDEALKILVGHLKDRNFTAARNWIAENSDLLDQDIFDKLYENASIIVQKDSVPVLIKLLSDYMYQSAFAINKDINLAALFAEIIAHCEFK